MRMIKTASVFTFLFCLCLSGCQKNDIQISQSIAEEIALDDMNTNTEEVEYLKSQSTEDGYNVSYTYKDMNLNYLINNNGTIEHSSMKRIQDYEKETDLDDKRTDADEEEAEETEFSVSRNAAINSVLNYIGITEDLAEDLKASKEAGYYEISLTYAGVPYLLYVDGTKGTVSELPPEE